MLVSDAMEGHSSAQRETALRSMQAVAAGLARKAEAAARKSAEENARKKAEEAEAASRKSAEENARKKAEEAARRSSAEGKKGARDELDELFDSVDTDKSNSITRSEWQGFVDTRKKVTPCSHGCARVWIWDVHSHTLAPSVQRKHARVHTSNALACTRACACVDAHACTCACMCCMAHRQTDAHNIDACMRACIMQTHVHTGAA